MIALFARSLLWVWSALGLELALVVASRYPAFAGIWELQWGTLWLAPLAMAASLPLAGLGAGLNLSAFHAAQFKGRSSFTLFVAALGATAGWAVSSGRHFSDLGVRLSLVSGLVVTGALAAWGLGPAVAKLRRQRLRTTMLALVGALVLLEACNLWLFVRRYPGFHALLAGLFVLGAACLASPEPDARRERRHWVTLSLAGLALLCAPFASVRLAGFDNFRFILSEAAPALRFAVQLRPPVAFDFGADPAVVHASTSVQCSDGTCLGALTSKLDLRGRSLLLVTIDALRADHLGAYGYERPTSPHIDRLASEGALFERAYCATPHTSYSVTSLMTGKFMRPLLLQGAGQDTETWAGLLRTYGYRTAAFYPPAVFFIDGERFGAFEQTHLGFEYAKVEFAEGAVRLSQVKHYLDTAPSEHPLFLWVHLFGPHEPYVADAQFDFGQRVIDRYDSEVAAADRTTGELVELFRARDPRGVVIVSADHGEEFGDHGGAYHGTTVYEEQVRVPLVIAIPGVAPRHLLQPVQLVDLLPTVLAGLQIPARPRIRGQDLSGLLLGERAPSTRAYAETEDYTLLAESDWRLVCARRIGACQLYNLSEDPGQTNNVYQAFAERGAAMRQQLQALAASHGRFEQQGLRAEGQGWPAALMRALSGDVEAGQDVARLLDDADVEIRRKAAEVLFDLQIPTTAPALRLALGRDEDPRVRAFAALSLTRLGEGAPLALDLLDSEDRGMRRRAALALAETGDARGRALLIDWWLSPERTRFEDSVQILAALGRIGAKNLGWEIARGLKEPRLLPHVASTLGSLGDDAAIGPLLEALEQERSQKNRTALLEALLQLGASTELAVPLRRLMSEPEPFVDALALVTRAGVLQYVGGPDPKQLSKLRGQLHSGAQIRVQIPAGPPGAGVRLLVRAANPTAAPGFVSVAQGQDTSRINLRSNAITTESNISKSTHGHLELHLEAHSDFHDLYATVPSSMALGPGQSRELSVRASAGLQVEALALVPLALERRPSAEQIPPR